MKIPIHREAIAATIGFIVMICCRILLALGLSLVRAAWGGQYETPPTGKAFHIGQICEKPL